MGAIHQQQYHAQRQQHHAGQNQHSAQPAHTTIVVLCRKKKSAGESARAGWEGTAAYSCGEKLKTTSSVLSLPAGSYSQSLAACSEGAINSGCPPSAVTLFTLPLGATITCNFTAPLTCICFASWG